MAKKADIKRGGGMRWVSGSGERTTFSQNTSSLRCDFLDEIIHSHFLQAFTSNNFWVIIVVHLNEEMGK